MSTFYEAKEQIKNSADIVTLIGEYVRLKRAGKNYVGLCPFHSEKNPSFTVSPEKQIFHCYGCKKGGDVISFWMEYHNVDFVQAVKELAERYNINIDGGNIIDKGYSIKSMIYEINGVAGEYYHNILLKHPGAQVGRDYIRGRSFDKEVISRFKLGYALSEWDSLYNHLRKKGFDPELALKAGLIIRRKNGGYYDRFRGRIIFPIMNLKNQVVGFGARVLDSSLPKYLNTPETPVFSKGKILYGLNISNREIRDKGTAVVVEGYTDMISIYANGFKQVVATLGTSMTQEHIRLLKGYAKDVVVVFDSDEAGIKATIRSIGLFLNQGIEARVMILPEGQDPDMFVRKHGIHAFNALISSAMPMFDFYLEHIARVEHKTMDSKIAVLQEFIPVLLQVENEAMLYYLVNGFCERIDLPEKTVMKEVEKFRRTSNYVNSRERGLEERLKGLEIDDIAGFHLINLFINHPDTIDRMGDNDFGLLIKYPTAVRVVERLCDYYKREGKIDIGQVMEELDTASEKEYLREVSMAPSFYSDDEIEIAINDFKRRIRQKEISRLLSTAKEKGDLDTLNRLLREKSRILKRDYV